MKLLVSSILERLKYFGKRKDWMEEEGSSGLIKWIIEITLIVMFVIIVYFIWRKIESGVFG